MSVSTGSLLLFVAIVPLLVLLLISMSNENEMSSEFVLCEF